jgi:hypothetical protein
VIPFIGEWVLIDPRGWDIYDRFAQVRDIDGSFVGVYDTKEDRHRTFVSDYLRPAYSTFLGPRKAMFDEDRDPPPAAVVVFTG